MVKYYKNNDGTAIPYTNPFTIGRTEMLAKGYVIYDGTKDHDHLYFNSEGVLSEYTDEEYLTIQQQKLAAEEELFFSELYTNNPDLALRVKEYKELFTSIGLTLDANIDTVNTHISTLPISDSEKVALVLQITALYNNGIVYNLDYSKIPNPISFGWDNMSKLVQYLPVTEE